MKSIKLLPNHFKKVGWVLFSLSIALWIVALIFSEFSLLNANVFSIYADDFLGTGEWFGQVQSNLAYTITGVLCILGGLLVGFSKEKVEDEFIASLRLNSLLWAVLISYIILLVSFLTIYGLTFLHVLSYQMFSILLIFVFRFNYLLRKNRKEMANEE